MGFGFNAKSFMPHNNSAGLDPRVTGSRTGRELGGAGMVIAAAPGIADALVDALTRCQAPRWLRQPPLSARVIRWRLSPLAWRTRPMSHAVSSRRPTDMTGRGFGTRGASRNRISSRGADA